MQYSGQCGFWKSFIYNVTNIMYFIPSFNLTEYQSISSSGLFCKLTDNNSGLTHWWSFNICENCLKIINNNNNNIGCNNFLEYITEILKQMFY